MNKQKIIGVSIPCFNESENVVQIAEAVIEQFESFLPQYNYRIQFIDNGSSDDTRLLIKRMCQENKKICAIFNTRNFGGFSGYYGLMQAYDDCVINIACDFQVPVELIPQFVKKWEDGSKIVCAIKTSSEENPLMWGLRCLYYKLVKTFSGSHTEVLEHFTGAGLYDKSFLDICRSVDDSMPSMAQLVTTLGSHITKVEFVQPKRRGGKTKNNIWTLFDTAINRFINYSKMGPRIATISGFFISILSFFVGIVFFVLKLVYWDQFAAGIAPLIIGMFFVSAVQLFFTGLIGEYIISINTRLMKRPLVVEETRLNFDDDNDKMLKKGT